MPGMRNMADIHECRYLCTTLLEKVETDSVVLSRSLEGDILDAYKIWTSQEVDLIRIVKNILDQVENIAMPEGRN